MRGECMKQLSEVTILLIPVDVTQEHAVYEKSRSHSQGLNSPFLVQLILQQKSQENLIMKLPIWKRKPRIAEKGIWTPLFLKCS